jgi:hypothetical protein
MKMCQSQIIYAHMHSALTGMHALVTRNPVTDCLPLIRMEHGR